MEGEWNEYDVLDEPFEDEDDDSFDDQEKYGFPLEQANPNLQYTPRIDVPGSDKAGMENVDVAKVNQVVHEMSKDSKFYQNAQRKEQLLDRRIKAMLSKLSELPEIEPDWLLKKLDKKIQDLEAERDLTRRVLHVDMDAFYASVEIRDNPSLKNKPIAVGGMSMLSTSSYEARKFGVRSAMPGFIAKKLCPELIIVPGNFDKYKKASRQAQAVFAKYDPNFRSYSLDEASLDITDYLKSHPEETNASIATKIRHEVFEATQLTCSVGGGANRRLAKICTNVNKPDGQFLLENDREKIISFMEKLPTRKVGGIGKVTEKMLAALGITLCGHLYEKRALLHQLFSPSTAFLFLAMSLGIESKRSSSNRERKSVSTERTFQAISSLPDLMQKCDALSTSLAKHMKNKQLQGKTLTLKLKTHTFEVRSRSVTLSKCISEAPDIFKEASALLMAELPIKIRLMGIKLSHLESKNKPNPLLELISKSRTNQETNKEKEPQQCPICNESILGSDMNQHIDKCLESQKKSSGGQKRPTDSLPSKQAKKPAQQKTIDTYFKKV